MIKQFVFLFPIDDEFLPDIRNGAFCERSEVPEYRDKYCDLLNNCIDLRYRKKGYAINYLNYGDKEISNIIRLREDDNLLKLDMSLDEFIAINKGKTKDYIFPDFNKVLDSLGDFSSLRVAGFHRLSCVSEFARRGYERMRDVLVDEDLTERFPSSIKESEFDIQNYSGLVYKRSDWEFEAFMKSREGKPWLWQDY